MSSLTTAEVLSNDQTLNPEDFTPTQSVIAESANMSDFIGIETPDNYEQKCLVILLIDTSGSMQNTLPKVKKGLKEFQDAIRRDSTAENRVELCIMEFNHTVNVLREPALLSRDEDLSNITLQAAGTTNLVGGFYKAVDIINKRKEKYHQTGEPYYRPWMVIFSDGVPDPNNYEQFSNVNLVLQEATNKKSFNVFSIAVLNDANKNTNTDNMINALKNFTNMPNLQNPFVARMEDANFADMFMWLSNSLTTVTHSKEGDQIIIQSPVEAGWTV